MKHLLRAMGAAMLAALLLSACSTPQEQTEPSAPQTTQATQATQAATGATEESATEAEELLALPRDLGSGLTLQAVLPFSGPNVDADGAESDQLATIIVQNDGGMAVGAADITLTCEDGAELRFRVTDLPVGGSCYAFELNSAQYTGENRVCAASAEVEPDGSLSVDYRVSVIVQDGGLVLVNMTEDTMHNVTVRYRTDTGGTYFGGLSYTATVEELAPGASQTVLQDRAVEIAQLVRQLIDLPAVFAGAQLHADGLLADRDVLIVLLALIGVIRDLDDAAADIVRGLLHRRHRHGGRLLRKAIEHQEHDGRRQQHPQAAPQAGRTGAKGQHGQRRAAAGREHKGGGVRQPGLAADKPDGEHDAGSKEKQCAQNGRGQTRQGELLHGSTSENVY